MVVGAQLVCLDMTEEVLLRRAIDSRVSLIDVAGTQGESRVKERDQMSDLKLTASFASIEVVCAAKRSSHGDRSASMMWKC